MVRMPFGRFKDRLIRDIDTGYLRWLMANVPLRAGLKLAVEAELRARQQQVPESPPPRPIGPCPRCGASETSLEHRWALDSLGRKMIRRACGVCQQWRGSAAWTVETVREADALLDPKALVNDVAFLRMLVHDLKEDSTAYQHGFEDGVRHATSQAE